VKHEGNWAGASRLPTPTRDPVRKDVTFGKQDPVMATDARFGGMLPSMRRHSVDVPPRDRCRGAICMAHHEFEGLRARATAAEGQFAWPITSSRG
jgi:hypothetical protein